MGINQLLGALALSATCIGAQATERNPTMMELQIGKATTLCNAVNAQAGKAFNCNKGKLLIDGDGAYTRISRRVEAQTGELLDTPLVLQIAPKPNGPAKFAIMNYDLDKTLWDNYEIIPKKKR